MSKNKFFKRLLKNDIIHNGLLTHIFNVEENYYVYDAASSEIFKVSPFDSQLINALSNNSKVSRLKSIYNLTKDYSEVKILNGINKIEKIQEKYKLLKPIKTDFDIALKVRHNSFNHQANFNQLVLEVTQNCNFRCRYCPESGNYYIHKRKHSKLNMTKDTAFRSIYFFLTNTKYSNPSISFYGGEPLLRKKLIKDCMNYARQINPYVQFRIQTNGYLLNKDFFHDIKKYNVRVGLSLDGPKFIHDENRILKSGKGTFEKILANLKQIAEIDLEYILKDFIILITLFSKKYIDEIIDFFRKDFLLKNIRVSINSISTIGLKKEVEKNMGIALREDFSNQARERYIKMYSKNKWKYLNIEHALFFPLLRLLIQRKPLLSKSYFEKLCPLGEWRLFVNTKGDFRACEKTYRLPVIGNIKEGLNWNLINKMEEDYLSTCKPCYNCWALKICNVCWIHIYGEQGRVDQEIKNRICKIKRNEFSKALGLFVEIIDKNPEAFEIVPLNLWKI